VHESQPRLYTGGRRTRPHHGPADRQLGIRDRQLATLMRAMEAEARAGCPAGPLYGELLSLALAAYVAGRYSVGAPRARPQAGRLSAPQLAIVQEYIRTNLGSRLSLAELPAWSS